RPWSRASREQERRRRDRFCEDSFAPPGLRHERHLSTEAVATVCRRSAAQSGRGFRLGSPIKDLSTSHVRFSWLIVRLIDRYSSRPIDTPEQFYVTSVACPSVPF